MQETPHIVYLLKQYLKGTIHADSNQELKALFDKYPDLFILVKDLDDPENLQRVLREYKNFHSTTAAHSKERVLNNVLQQIQVTASQKDNRVILRKVLPYLAAACVAVLLMFGIWRLNYTYADSELQLIKQAEKLTPGGNKAILTAPDGKTIILDQEHDGIVVGDNITYEDGSILLTNQNDENPMMMLTTPKGGQYQITLPDGTKVWLNADSKIKYTKKFASGKREVELEGEAYFEVAKNALQPFIVRTPREQIEVLGTHFNVNSYNDEEISKVALLEGSVKVSTTADTKMLLPGQQSLVNDKKMAIQKINVEETIAWKNGEFMFTNEGLATAMRQIARWYDIDIHVDPILGGLTLWGSVSRFDNFDKVLKVIKMTDDDIKIKIEGRRVDIMK